MGSAEPEAIRNTPWTGAWDRLHREKMQKEISGNYLVGYSLEPIWLFVTDCP